MVRVPLASLALAVSLAFTSTANADVVARIDVSAQRMDVFVDGSHAHSWAVSTGRDGFPTPHGNYRAKRTHRHWYSTKYDNAPMPYSVFFRGGYAVHGTTEVRRLGRRASHGCVRLHPTNAATLFYLVRGHGLANSRIVIGG